MSTRNGQDNDDLGGTEPENRPHECFGTFGLILVVEDGRISMANAWPLLLFTWITPYLVALKLDSLPICRLDQPWPILFGGIVALALSTAHRRRSSLAWRAKLGFRNSWFSREILAFILFVGLAGLLPLLMRPSLPLIPSLAAGLTGLFVLHAMDRVYRIALPGRSPGGIHSAETLITAVVYTVALRGWSWLLIVALSAKLLLWAPRYLGNGRLPLGPLALLRVLVGLALPGLLMLAGQAPTDRLLMAALLGGELLDRASFYRELRFPTITPREER